ncbi:beta-ribofuranosylaminobenzene 5'-phosphate synthase family protein [Methylophaga sp.]|uniref:beta-ribofuranosylaminobenzene 5'-phosphate synthase family protein n=1 Tax=Methylophaga sp. TaxID=2024840 RepID=UPI0014012A96|nr:beta-ribofuranosylaminobenzene 5'-phosphate synthase family protein [Methylophaga sp.]MTI63640.1 beta-hydroxylase [Methylophaga sp.]
MQSVTVRAPARLHLGFLDLNASIGRRFGSIGLAVASHHTKLSISPADVLQIEGDGLLSETHGRLENIYQRFYQTLGQYIPENKRPVSIRVHELIPEHAGLGSGTQLALTLGTALSHLHRLDINTTELAKNLGRGKRSGIGIATFDLGGFVIDGGLKPDQTVPPMLMHHAYPEPWRVVMVMDPHHQGIHGQHEKQAFGRLPTFPLENSRAICHLTLMQLLPSLSERDINSFGSALTEIQKLIGDHFASAQGGRYTSPLVAACLQEAQKLGHTGIAQSSWGPTGCIFVSNQSEADLLIQQLNEFIAAESASLPVFISAAADNQGAIIETVL